jgi:hypothetical protein
VNAGDVFIFPEAVDDHHWTIVSDPTANSGRVVIVRFVTWKEWSDHACELQAGDHPFIKHLTCVDYPEAREVTLEMLNNLHSAGRLKLKSPLSPQIRQRIRDRAIDSRIPSGQFQILREQGLIKLK